MVLVSSILKERILRLLNGYYRIHILTCGKSGVREKNPHITPAKYIQLFLNPKPLRLNLGPPCSRGWGNQDLVLLTRTSGAKLIGARDLVSLQVCRALGFGFRVWGTWDEP